jgi:hypothetical protein
VSFIELLLIADLLGRVVTFGRTHPTMDESENVRPVERENRFMRDMGRFLRGSGLAAKEKAIPTRVSRDVSLG